MKSQKIVVVIDAFAKGGAQKILQITIAEWLKMSIKVELILIQNSAHELEVKHLEALGLKVHRLNAVNIFSLLKFTELYKTIKRLNSDQIYAHLYWSQIWCGCINLFNKKAKIIWVEHNTYFDRSRTQWLFYKIVSTRVFKIIAVSSEVKKYLQNRTSSPIQVILNPIVIRNLKGIRNFSKPLFVFVGRLNKQKNPLLAIKAFEYALRNNLIPPNSKFNFVGDGPLLKEIETFIESNSLKKSAKLLGFLNLNEISKIYSQSMTLVSTSEYEGFSLARVEAASSGCAVVTTMTSGILGVLTKSEQNKKLITGIFIVESDVVKIAHVLRESLAKKYWVTNSISERKNILKNHDPKSIAGKYLVN
jgi:glycosyltransferase involved in cell wall biosynthesis